MAQAQETDPQDRRQPRMVLSAEMTEDSNGAKTIICAAALHPGSTTTVQGAGAPFVLECINRCILERWQCCTFQGLQLFAAHNALLPTDAAGAEKIASFAKSKWHVDVAFDFAADNGYDVLWTSLGKLAADAADADGAAKALKALACTAEETGVMIRQTLAGKLHPWPLPGGASPTLASFRSVPAAADACRLYPPDQSWMTHDDVQSPLKALDWIPVALDKN